MKTYELYGGKYHLTMHPATHRYNVNGDLKVGVTGILSRTVAKEGLALWPLDEAMKYLFGQEFEETLQDNGDTLVRPLYNLKNAFLKPERLFSKAQLQQALEAARNAHITKRDKGGDVGTRVHHYIEQYLTGGLDAATIIDEPTEVKKAVKAFLDWYETQNIETVVAERPVFSEQYQYCGTPDHIIKLDGQLIVNDYKTTNYSKTAPLGIYAENFAQVGAYAFAYMEEFPTETIDDLMITNISKQGKVNVVKASDLGLTVDECILFWLDIFNVNKRMTKLKKGLQARKAIK